MKLVFVHSTQHQCSLRVDSERTAVELGFPASHGSIAHGQGNTPEDARRSCVEDARALLKAARARVVALEALDAELGISDPLSDAIDSEALRMYFEDDGTAMP